MLTGDCFGHCTDAGAIVWSGYACIQAQGLCFMVSEEMDGVVGPEFKPVAGGRGVVAPGSTLLTSKGSCLADRGGKELRK